MEKAESATRGTFVLATVKGDVHDIGKNLVEIILANNGYRVINLGIKVPPETLIAPARAQARRHWISGLLVKSAQQMVVTAQDFRVAASTSRCSSAAPRSRGVHRDAHRPEHAGLTVYAKDAMDGLDSPTGSLPPPRARP